MKQSHLQTEPCADILQMDGDGNFDGLSAMGFSTLHNFEEVSCDAATMVSFRSLNADETRFQCRTVSS